MASKSSSSGISLTGVLFVLFLVLKLTGNIDWSWWWVTSPLWIPVALAFSFLIILMFSVILLMVFGFSADDIKNKFERYKNN
jgi:hypothetical protein